MDKDVAVSRPLSVYLSILLRAQSLAGVLERNARALNSDGILAGELKIIRQFEEGLEKNRFELHGPLTSPTIGNVLAHHMDLCDASSFDHYCRDVGKFAVGADKDVWEGMTSAQRDELKAEAAELGKQAESFWHLSLSAGGMPH